MLSCRVLGPTELGSGRDRVDLGGPLPRRLVTALVAAGGRPVGGDALTLAVWGDQPPASPEVSLQAYVSRLRRALGEHRDALQRIGDGYRLSGADTDVAAFEAEVARGRELLDGQRPAEAEQALDAALRLWRGEAFADMGLSPAVEAARARLQELRLVAVEERSAARLAVGDAPGAVAELTSAVRAEPYRERRWELLILGLYRSARQAEALSALRTVRGLLADDLGLDPGPALQTLERRLLAQDPGLLLPARPVPPRPAVATPTVTLPLSAFVGRTAEMAVLAGALPSVRLLTLVGPGGAGKTRLVVEYAAAHQGGDGPWLARLADVTDPALLVSAIATAAGVQQRSADGVTGLGAALAGRDALLILDNCEHLVAAVADLTMVLPTRCPRLRILATSREPLGVDGERLLPVTPLPPADAVALLTDRIGAVRPGWRPDVEDYAQLRRLAAALDGIPLALELAAARARVIGLGELVTLLGDRFPALGRVPRGALAPHATLEAAVAWSVDLLPPGDRALLLRLWPFEGGFTVEAAAAVGSDLEALSSLVTRSVVAADTTVTPTRYRLLEIIRAYCREHDPDPVASRAAHAAWARALVQRAARELRGERSAHAIRVLNREIPNLRAALSHDLAADPPAALRTAGRLEWFWMRGGHVEEGLRVLTAALAGAPDAPAVDRSLALASCGTLRFISGDLDGAAECLRQARALLAEPDSAAGWRLVSQLLYYEALMWTAYGDCSTAAARARESIAMSVRIGERWATPAGEMALGGALTGLGDLTGGRRMLQEAAAHAGELRQNWIAAMSELLLARAWLDRADPDPEAALRALGASLARFREEDDVGNLLSCLHTGAYALTLSGRPEQGAVLLAAVRRHAARRGLRLEATDPVNSAALRAALSAALDPVTRAAADTDGAALEVTAMIAMLPAGQDQGHARR